MFSTMYIKLAGIALIVAALVGCLFYVQHLRSEVTNDKAQMIALQSQIAVLADKLVQQNAAVDALAKAGDARLAAAQADLAVAKTTAAKYKAQATNAYNAKPAYAGNTCEADRQSALQILNGSN